MGFYVGEDTRIGQRGRPKVIWSLSKGEEIIMVWEMGDRNQASRFGEMSEQNVMGVLSGMEDGFSRLEETQR